MSSRPARATRSSSCRAHSSLRLRAPSRSARSDADGGLRKRGCTTLKKALHVGIPVVIVLAFVAVIVVPLHPTRGSVIATEAVGVWQETDSPEAYKLVIRPNPGAASDVACTVTYPRSFKVPFPASLSGNEILIWGENKKDVVWTVAYDEQTDTLTLTRPHGGESHTLKRIRDRDTPAPKWLLEQASEMAKQGKATQAWWTKTTLEEELRVVEPGHWQKPSVRNGRATYLLVMRGVFSPRSIRMGASPGPVAWGFEVIDPVTHLVDESGGTNSSPHTGGLDLHEIDLQSLLGAEQQALTPRPRAGLPRVCSTPLC